MGWSTSILYLYFDMPQLEELDIACPARTSCKPYHLNEHTLQARSLPKVPILRLREMTISLVVYVIDHLNIEPTRHLELERIGNASRHWTFDLHLPFRKSFSVTSLI